MKKQREIQDRLKGNILELDGYLNPQTQDVLLAADRQGWIRALSWVLENENTYDRSDEIKDMYDRKVEK